MINLLPPQEKDAIHYGRQNVRLLGWLIAFSLAIIGVFVIIGFGQFYIDQATQDYKEQISQSEETLAEQNIDEVQAKVQEITNTLTLVGEVLSRQVLFSDLIQAVGGTIPEGAVLTGLTISQIEGGIDLLAEATDYNTATQVQVNLEDADNPIFASADIISVRCSNQDDTQDTDIAYPCQINIRALFGENSQFLLIPRATPAQDNEEDQQ